MDDLSDNLSRQVGRSTEIIVTVLCHGHRLQTSFLLKFSKAHKF